MKTFKDSGGKSWDISITVGSLKRVKDMLNIDLIEEASKKENIFIKVSENPIMLCDILYCLCKSQADERKITDEKFGESLNGDAIEQATNMFIEELIDFFPSAKRPAFRMMTQKIEEMTTKGVEYVTKYLNSEEMETKIMSDIKKASGI